MPHLLAVPAFSQQGRRPTSAPFGGAPLPASARAVVGPASNDRTDPGGAGAATKAAAGLGASGSLRTPRARTRRIMPILPPGKGSARRALGAVAVSGVGE